MNCICVLPTGGELKSSDFVWGETPGGAIDCVNLAYSTAKEFVPGSLEVWLGGDRLEKTDYSEGLDFMSFTILLNPAQPDRLNSAPRSSESLEVNYICATVSGGCITSF